VAYRTGERMNQLFPLALAAVCLAAPASAQTPDNLFQGLCTTPSACSTRTQAATSAEQEYRPLFPPQNVGAPLQATSVAVAQALTAPAPMAILSASASSIPSGRSSTLTWSSANATTCSGTGFSASGASGSVSVSPTVTTTYAIACTGAGGSASQSVTVAVADAPTPAIGMTVRAANSIYLSSTPSQDAPLIGSEASGSQGEVIGGPVSNSFTYWQVAFDDNLTGWIYQDGIAAASPGAPTLTFSAKPQSIASGGSSTLSWSSTNATSCRGTGFSPSSASGSLSVSPTKSTTYSITCTGSGGSTTRTTPVLVNSPPAFSWRQSLPVTFGASGIVPFGGTDTRALVFMDGSLYAGIGDLRDPEFENPKTPGAQVLRLDSPTGSWVEDKDFNQLIPGTTNKNYQAISILGTAHFDHDSARNPIAPVDVLMAGFWSLGQEHGLTIFEKTVLTRSIGAKGTWTKINLVAPPQPDGQVRSFASYKDSVTHVEMAFAGGDSYGIFSGAFNSATGVIQWGATGEAGTAELSCPPSWVCHRVMSFALCGGKFYASIFDAIVVRTDGANPSWRKFYQYSGPALPTGSSGFRGLTCVPNLNGEGSMLIASLEGPGDIYDIPVNGSQPTIELNTSNYLSSQLGTRVGWPVPAGQPPVTAAFNNMIVYPQSGSTSCPDLLIGLSAYTGQYVNAYKDYYPTALFLVRHCNGFYHLRKIIDPSVTPAPPLRATRALAPSEFSGDPAGTLYSGGYAPVTSAHNTDWVYRGVPRRP
jgi:hypothetical protein